MSTKNHARADGNTTLTISLPVEMKARLQRLADAENRPVSNFVRHYLEHRVMDAFDTGNAPAPHQGGHATIAHTPVHYSNPRQPRKTEE
jgi:hypothetical protein